MGDGFEDGQEGANEFDLFPKELVTTQRLMFAACSASSKGLAPGIIRFGLSLVTLDIPFFSLDRG